MNEPLPIRRLSVGVEDVPLDSIQPHPRNVNVGDPEAIARSIAENGWYGRLKVSRATRFIVAGNHSWKGARLVGMESVPIEWLDLTPEEELRIVLVDNRLTRQGHDDDEKLLDLLRELQGTERGLSATGYSEPDVDELLRQIQGETPPPEGDASPSGREFANQYGVIVLCEDEAHQERVYGELLEAGYKLRVVVT